MRNMFKKVISLLLTIMMVLSIFTIVPMTASAIELTDNALLESQDGDELTYSSNKFNEVGTSGGDSRLVFSESNITIAGGDGGVLTSKDYKDEVLALSKGTFLIKYTSTNKDVQSLFSVSKKDSNNTHFHIYVYGGKIGMESRNGGASNATNSFVTGIDKVTTSGTNTIAVSYSNNTYTVYANGQKIEAFTGRTSFISNLSSLDDVRVGSTCRLNSGKVGDLTYKFTGDIEFINCYNDALSDEELIHLTSSSVTVKSLYKSHKIEWTSTEISDINNFTIEDNSGNDISSKLTKLEPVTVDGTNYFTALVEVGTNASIGTIYTVKKTDDGTVIGKATVTDTTGKQALKKNAVYAYVNDSGYVINAEANKKIEIATSASTGTKKVLFQKLQNLSKGSVIADFKPTTTGNNNIALIGGTNINNLWIGFTVSSSVQYYTFNNKNSFVKFGSNTSTDRREVAMCMNGTNVITAISGVAKDTLTGMDTSRLLGTAEKDYYYIGGTNNNQYTGSTSNKFTIYSLIISEEVYTSDEIKLITQKPYDAVQAVLAEAQNHVDGYAVKYDANYRKLQSEIAKYSNCSTSISEVESNTIVKALKDAISALSFRETYKDSVVVPIDKELLKKNAKDNNHAQGSEVKDSNGNIISYNDGKAEQLFDNNLDSKWHSNYDKNGVGKSTGVNADNNVWMQTGFDGKTKYITKIVCTPRTDMNEDQIKTYQVYVSKNNEQPSVDAVADSSNGWELVKEDTLEQCTSKDNSSARQVITLDEAKEAKWVRIVVSSVYNRSNGHFLAITEMDIYEKVNETPIDIQLLKDNAKDNNHAQGSLKNGVYNDGDSKQLFDGKSDTFWHSNYNNSDGKPNGIGIVGVTESNPAWMQTGFGGATKYISKIEAYTRTGSTNNQLKKYAIYVSTSENAPDVNTSVVDSDEWTFVCGGELKAFTTTYQMHTIKFAPVEAKWVRLVAYSTSTGDHLAMSEMKIYEVNSANVAITDNGRKLLNKLPEIKEIMTRNDVCIDSKYNTLVSLYNKYTESDLPLISTQANIDNLVNSINAINVNNSANKTAIDKNTLKTNADANTYANRDSDLPATAAFDGSNGTWWHTNWDGSNGKGGLVVAENTPAWIQTGFGGAKNVTAIDLIPRSSYECQIKKYEIYVSNADSKPDINTAPSAETGWTLVANGTFSFLAKGNKHTVTFQPIEAKWIRLVAYSAMDTATKSTNFATIGEMNVYEATSYTHKAEVINNNLTDKLSQAKKLALRADIDANALNTAIESLGAIDLTKLTEEELQAKLNTITGAVSTTPSAKTLNKSGEQSFDSDSVKWNSSNDRLQILKNNAKGTKAEGSPISVLFDGNAQVSVNQGEYYGTYNSGTKTPWIQTGFNDTICLSGIVVYDRYNTANNGNAQDTFDGYEIWVSNDEDFATYEVAAIGTRTDKTYKTSGYAIKFATPYNCKYVRFNMKNNTEYLKLCEIDIYEYVGKSEEVQIRVTSVGAGCEDIKVNDAIGKALTLNRKYSDKFTQDEVNKQLLSQGISLNDLAHDYNIEVSSNGEIQVEVTKAEYKLHIYKNDAIFETLCEEYNSIFNYTIKGCTAWRIGDSKTGSIICTGDTFNYRATGDIAVYAVTENISSEISVYIPEPIVSYNNSETVVEIPVYVIGTRNLVEKGIVFVMGNTDTVTEDSIKKYVLKEEFNDNIYSFSSKVGLTNRGRYIQKLNTSGKWPNGTFYGYIVTKDANNNIVTLSQAREYSGI